MAKNALKTLVTEQDVTAAYADFGGEIDVSDYTKLGVWVSADVNDGLNVSLKAIGLHTTSGTEFEVNSYSVIALWTTVVSNFSEYYEFDVGALNFVKLQAIAGTAGSTAADLTIETTKK